MNNNKNEMASREASCGIPIAAFKILNTLFLMRSPVFDFFLGGSLIESGQIRKWRNSRMVFRAE